MSDFNQTIPDFNLRQISTPIEAMREEVLGAYRRLDDHWACVEEQLSKLLIPCGAGVTIGRDPDGSSTEMLEWRKWKGHWRVYLVLYHVANEDSRECEPPVVTPYEEWSGAQRAALLSSVPDLFKAIELRTKRFIAEASG